MATPKLYPVSTPVPMSSYPLLATTLLAIGLCLMASFFLYGITRSKATRSLTNEIVLAAGAAGTLGLGTLFLLLWTGVYV